MILDLPVLFFFVRYDTMATHEEKHRQSETPKFKSSPASSPLSHFGGLIPQSNSFSLLSSDSGNDADRRSVSSADSQINGNGVALPMRKRPRSASPSTSTTFSMPNACKNRNPSPPRSLSGSSQSSDGLREQNGISGEGPMLKKLKFIPVAFLPNGRASGQPTLPAPDGACLS